MPLTILNRLYEIILVRSKADKTESYIAQLYAKGVKKMAQKVGEEAVETALASASGDKQEIISESADLLFHLLILLSAHQITLDDVCHELERREGMSGIEEKAQRNN